MNLLKCCSTVCDTFISNLIPNDRLAVFHTGFLGFWGSESYLSLKRNFT